VPDVLTLVGDVISWVYNGFFGIAIRLSPILLGTYVLIAFFIWRKERPGTGFFAWLFPLRYYPHRSHFVDIKLFVFGQGMNVLNLFAVIAVGSVIATWTVDWLVHQNGAPQRTTPFTTEELLLATLILVMTSDFCLYWMHRLHHEFSVLWPFHSVHHSAEIMTPVTAYRIHPLYSAVLMLLRHVLGGFMQGIVLFFIIGDVTLEMVANVNLVYFLHNLAGANLRHSHVWLSYGPVFERIFSSPAQHQIHHSLAPRHYNKNYGEIFSIWDWMFGTLYVPGKKEEIEFGLAGEAGARIEQPHPTLAAAIMVPFRESGDAARKAIESFMASRRREAPYTPKTPGE